MPPISDGILDVTNDGYTGTVSTSYTAVPSSAGGAIYDFIVICKIDQVRTNRLIVSLDGGTTDYATLAPGGHYAGCLRGESTQIHIKGNVSSVGYEITLVRAT